MEKQIITFSANEQCLQKTGGVDCYASNTVAYIEAHFDLGTNWSGYDSVRAVWFTDFVSGISTVLDSDGVCIVPHEVLTRKSAVKVNLVGSIADGDVLTDRLTTCPVTAVAVKCNAKVTGANSTPITPSEYEQFVQNVKADADRAEAGATAAEQSAVNANASADEAEASAQNASESASASAISASDSARSATASAESAQNASESAQNAENAKDDAESARDKILSMRATASTLPAGSDATASYSDGLLSLGIPKGDKGDTGAKGDKGDTGATPNFSIGTVSTLEPNTDATATITGTAEEPILNLGIPKGEQGDVNLSQLEALLPTETASGEIVTITDGQAVVPAKSLKVTLEPIQDLNGYDKPWSGGAGKNLCPPIQSTAFRGVTTTTNEMGVTTVSGTAEGGGGRLTLCSAPFTLQAGTYTFSHNGTGTWGDGLVVSVDGGAAIAECRNVATYIQLTLNSATTVVVGISVTAGVSYNGTVSPQLEAGSTATSWTPYSNICPISGHTEVATEVCGKNLLNPILYSGGQYNPSIGTRWTLTESAEQFENPSEGVFTLLCPTTWMQRVLVFEMPDDEADYYLRLARSSTGDCGTTLGWLDADYTVLTASSYTSASYEHSFALANRPSGAKYYYITLTNRGTANAVLTVTNPQIELGSTATDYEPYQGTSYTTTLGRTVYGGTLDVVSGELVVDRAMVAPTSVSGVTHHSSGTWYCTIRLNDTASADDALMSNMFVMGYLTDGVGACYTTASGAILVIVLPQDVTTIADADAWLEANQPTFVYRLATPQTIQLTPQEVQLLLGTNNVWSDGNVTLVYSADIQKWVEKKLNANSTTSILTMSRPMVQTETTETEETETETAETE